MVCCTMAKVGSVGSYETDVIPKRHLNANISASTYAANVKNFFCYLLIKGYCLVYVIKTDSKL